VDAPSSESCPLAVFVISRVEPLGSATCYGKSCCNFVALPWVNGDYAAIDNDFLLRETLTLRYFKNKFATSVTLKPAETNMKLNFLHYYKNSGNPGKLLTSPEKNLNNFHYKIK
jgi:hypothetical protein